METKVLLFAALYGYKKWFLTWREEHKLQAFQNKTDNFKWNVTIRRVRTTIAAVENQ